MADLRGPRFKYIAVGVVVVFITGSVVAAAAIPSVRQMVTRWLGGAVADADRHKKSKADQPVELIRDARGNAGVRLKEEACSGLGISPVEVKLADGPRPLPPQVGTLNYDNERLFTIRSRFPGEVAEIRQVPDLESGVGHTQRRFLRPSDKIKQDELLMVVWSQSLGTAKAALVDAVGALRLSEDAQKRAKMLYGEGAIAVAVLKQYERQVQIDTNAMLTAERSLRYWKLTEKEIEEIKTEAKAIADERKVRLLDDELKWARVEIRSPKFKMDPNDPSKPDSRVELTVVEKNTNINDMVDPTNSGPLLKLADLSRLQIWVQPPPEYVSLLKDRLNRTGKPIRWRIRFQGETNAPELDLTVSHFLPSIDPNQHTGMIVGYLDNPNGKYLVGQFLTATIFMPPDEDTVEMPTDALNEVEGQSLVFVQKDPAKREFMLRRVSVLRRFKDATFVRSKLTPEDVKYSEAEVKRGRRPLEPLLPGERVITRGVVELTAALDELLTQTPTTKAE